jgi:hypothetical protein
MSNIERASQTAPVARAVPSGGLAERMQTGRTNRALAAIEHRTLVRLGNVQAEGMVANEKVREVGRVVQTAMSGHAFLKGWANQLAGDDLTLIEDMRFYTDTNKLGVGEIMSDTLDNLRRI